MFGINQDQNGEQLCMVVVVENNISERKFHCSFNKIVAFYIEQLNIDVFSPDDISFYIFVENVSHKTNV